MFDEVVESAKGGRREGAFCSLSMLQGSSVVLMMLLPLLPLSFSSGEREFGCCRNRGRGGVKEEEMKDLDDEEDEEEEAVFSLFLPMGIF